MTSQTKPTVLIERSGAVTIVSIAHAGHADTWRLRQAVFEGGWFSGA